LSRARANQQSSKQEQNQGRQGLDLLTSQGQPQGQAGIEQALQQAAQQQTHGEQAETPGNGPQEAAMAPLQGDHGHARGQGQEQFRRRAWQDQQQDQHQPIGRQGEPTLPPLGQGQDRQAELGH